jgi:hypothetical protein
MLKVEFIPQAWRMLFFHAIAENISFHKVLSCKDLSGEKQTFPP